MIEVYEVNYNTIGKWIPWDTINTSKYVRAENAKQAQEIAIRALKIKATDICFVCLIETIN